MAITSSRPAVTITIPSDYLEDARSALVREIDDDSNAIRSNHEDVLRGSDVGGADRAGSVRILREDIQLLDQVLDASGDTTVTGEPGAVTHALDAMARVLSARLEDACGYSPMPMGDVLDVAAELRWAADEAIRIDPERAESLTQAERAA